VTRFRINEAADLLGVSPDTVRRWADSGRLVAHRDTNGHRVVEGADLADYVRRANEEAAVEGRAVSSARNRLRGLVTAVQKDGVMAQVEIQAGPHRLVSLMSREAVDELGLAVGSVAYAVIKSTNVIVELPRG
jgi:molybdopterin-binding protein